MWWAKGTKCTFLPGITDHRNLQLYLGFLIEYPTQILRGNYKMTVDVYHKVLFGTLSTILYKLSTNISQNCVRIAGRDP